MAKPKLSEAEQYQARIYEWLDRLPAGVYELTKFVKPENREIFLEISKQYIDERGRGINGFDVDFSEDYTRIHKFDLVLEK